MAITNARSATSEEMAGRIRRYSITMAFRMACFLSMLFVHGWLRWALLACAVFLPYVAVVLANQSDQRSRAHPVEFGAPNDAPQLTTGEPLDVVPGEVIEGSVVEDSVVEDSVVEDRPFEDRPFENRGFDKRADEDEVGLPEPPVDGPRRGVDPLPSGPDGLLCSAKGCRSDATTDLRWNNPKIHAPDRRKHWLACAEHRASLTSFLSSRGFLRETAELG